MRGTILLISQAFPPEPIVGALRAGNVARAFRDAGYSVIVITAAMEGEPPGLRVWQPGIVVHAVALGARYRERLTRFIRKLQSLVPFRRDHRRGAPEPASAGDARPASGGGLRALLLSLVWIPDDELRFVWPGVPRRPPAAARTGRSPSTPAPPSHSTMLPAGLLLQTPSPDPLVCRVPGTRGATLMARR